MKFKKGDKFILEIEDEFKDDKGKKLFKMKGFNSLVFDLNGLERLEKLNLQDLEEVFNTCYENGYSDGRTSVALDLLFSEEKEESDDSVDSCDHVNDEKHCKRTDKDKNIKNEVDDPLISYLSYLFGLDK